MGCGLLLLAAAAAALLARSAVLAAVAGPYNLVLRELAPCVKEEAGDTGDDLTCNVMMRYNRTIKGNTATGNATVKNSPFQRGVTTVVFDVAKWDPVSGWREHFLMMPVGDFCFLMEEVGKDTLDLLRNHMVPKLPRKCPIVNGVYTVHDVPARISQLRHFPMLPYGKFRVHVLGTPTKRPEVKRPRICIKLVVDVNPKI